MILDTEDTVETQRAQKKIRFIMDQVEQILPVHRAQLLTYLKHAEKKVGLLFNFNVPLLKEGGIHRFKM
ncbi:MAG: GxxExxY protein [Caldilineales bacterium]|nr:GxxExxY protein [Caldilineales bacterium]